MKLYTYRLKDKDLIETGNSVDSKYPLYAFTTDKDVAIIFEGSHKMKKFIKDIKKLSDSEVGDFITRHEGNELRWQDIRVPSVKPDDDYFKLDYEWYSILMTENEYELLTMDVNSGRFFAKFLVPSINIFSNDIKISLENIGYKNYCKAIKNNKSNSKIFCNQLYQYIALNKPILNLDKVDLIID